MTDGKLRLKVLAKPVLFFFTITMLCFGCKNEAEKTPDVSNISIDLKTYRLDKDLAAIDTNNIAEGLKNLQTKYPDFLNFYLDTLMGFNINGDYEPANPGIANGLRTFLTYPDFRNLFDTVAHHYPDTKSIDENLVKGFQFLRHYYPNTAVPKIIYLVSGLNNYAAFTYGNDIVGVGLDMYLGEQYPFYASVGIAAYSTRRFKPEYIPVHVFQALYRDRHPFVMEDRSLLNMMIQLGKEQYFLKKILPFTNDTTRLGYTQSQLQWCEASEEQVYNFFVSQNLLYEKSWQKMIRYVNDGPNAAGMPAESPGNIGTWMGYQIVKAYINEHPETPLDSVLQQKDAQTFLQESGYKPK